MAFILPIEEPWTSQPQVAVGIDWSNPLTKDLVFAYEGAAPRLNMVNGALATQGSSVSQGTGKFGRETVYSGSQASGDNSFGQVAWLSGATATSFDILIKVNSANPTGIICSQWDGTNQNWLFQMSSGSLIWIPCDDASGNRTRFDTSGAFPSAGYYRIQAAWWGQSNKLLVINGVTKSPTALSTNGATINGSFDAWQLGIASGQLAVSESIVFCRAWRRALSASEFAQLSANPWQIFAP